MENYYVDINQDTTASGFDYMPEGLYGGQTSVTYDSGYNPSMENLYSSTEDQLNAMRKYSAQLMAEDAAKKAKYFAPSFMKTLVTTGLNIASGGVFGITKAIADGAPIDQIAVAAATAVAGGAIADASGLTDAFVGAGLDSAYASTLAKTIGSTVATGGDLEDVAKNVLYASAQHGYKGGDFYNTEADRASALFGGGSKLNDQLAKDVTAKTGIPQTLSDGGSVTVNDTGGLTIRGASGALEEVVVKGSITLGGTAGTVGVLSNFAEGKIPTASDALAKAARATNVVTYNPEKGTYTYSDGTSPTEGSTVVLDGQEMSVGKNANGALSLLPSTPDAPFNPKTDYVYSPIDIGVDQPALKTIDAYVQDFNKNITVETVSQGTPTTGDTLAKPKEEGLFDGLDIGISKPEMLPAETAPTMEVDTSYKVEVPQETKPVETTGNKDSGGGSKDGSEATASDAEKAAEKAKVDAAAAKAANDPAEWAKEILASGGLLTGGLNDITYAETPTITSAPAEGGSTSSTTSPAASGAGNEGSQAPVGSTTTSGVGGSGGGTAVDVVSASASGSGSNFTTPDGVEYAIDDITAMPVAVGSTRVGADGKVETFNKDGRWESEATSTGTAPTGKISSVVTPSGNPADNPSITPTPTPAPVVPPTPVETPSVGTVGEADNGAPVAPEEVVDPFGDTTAEDSTIEDTTSGTGGDGGSAIDGTGTVDGASDTTDATGTGVEGTVDGGLGSDGTVGGTGNGEGTGEGEGTGDGTGDGSGSGSGSGNGSGMLGGLGGYTSGSPAEAQAYLEGIKMFRLSQPDQPIYQPTRYEQQKAYIDKLFEGLI